MEGQERSVELANGTIHYRELGPAAGAQGDSGSAPIVFVHGVFANGLLWRNVAPPLAAKYRCIVPDWPLGAHPAPMRADADLSVPGQARLVADFLEALGLREVTLVGNDSGGAIAQLVAARFPERVGRLVLTPCDAYEVFPPALFAYLSWVPRIPGLSAAMTKMMLYLPFLRRLPIAFGWLSKTRIPAEVLEAWVRPAATRPGVRRDLGKFLRSVSPQHTLQAARELSRFERPVLLLWSPDNGLFPLALAERFVRELPDARLVRIEEAGVFVAEDRPEEVAAAIEAFQAGTRGQQLAS